MYLLRVLIGGDIYIIRVSDNVRARYKTDGTPVYGSHNLLQLEPHNVKELAATAEANWFSEHVR